MRPNPSVSEQILRYYRFNMAVLRQCACNNSGRDCSTSWGRALITGVSKEWVTSWCLCQWTRCSTIDNVEMLASSSGVKNAHIKQNKEHAPLLLFFHRVMLNRLCSTPDTQADWINKHYRSKEDCFCVFLSFQWVCLSKQDSKQENILLILWCSVWFVQEGLHVLPLKIICEVMRSSGNRPVITKLQIESSQAFNHCRIESFFGFNSKKKKSSAGRLTPPVPLICGWVSFHHFNNHFLPALVDHAKDYRGREVRLVLFALLVFLTGSYNTKLQPFSASAVLEIGYCISLKGGAIPWKSPLYELSHLPTHDKNCKSVEFYSFQLYCPQVD